MKPLFDGPSTSTLLIADDEPYICELLGDILKDVAENILFAADGEEASLLAQSHRIDCILSDFQMPRKTGMQLLEQMTGLGVPSAFVMLTAHTDQDKLSQALRLGAVDFVSKPFDCNQVFAIVTRALELGKRRRACLEHMQQVCVTSNSEPDALNSLGHKLKMMRLLQVVNSKDWERRQDQESKSERYVESRNWLPRKAVNKR